MPGDLTSLGVFAVGILVPLALTRIPGAHWLFAFARKPPVERAAPIAPERA